MNAKFTKNNISSLNIEKGYDIKLSDITFGNESTIEKHNYYELIFLIHGQLSCEIDKRSCIISEGTVVIIPPTVEHKITSYSSCDCHTTYIIINITDEYLMNSISIYPELGIIRDELIYNSIIEMNHRESFHLQNTLFKLIHENNQSRINSKNYNDLCVKQALILLSRQIYNSRMNMTNSNNLAYDICEYINNHLNEDLSLENLEVLFFHNKFYLSHIFKKETGLSIHKYIINARLTACCSAIENGEPICKLYSVNGFKDYSSFFRIFRKVYGMTPKQYLSAIKNKSK